MQETELSHLKAQLEILVRKAGAFILEESRAFSKNSVQLKGKNDMVSYVDLTSEKMLKEGCRKLIPGAGFVNEETDNELSENGYLWIIDPLDGTTSFVHGVPHYCISLALQFEEETLLGYVYDMNKDEMFMAEKGKGAWLNGEPIQVSSAPLLNTSLLATGFPYAEYDWLNDFVALFRTFLSRAQAIRRFGAAALDLAYVACGRYEAFFERTLNAWDIAAGALIIQEAGGRVSNFSGEDQFLYEKELIASNGLIHEEILEIVRENKAQRSGLAT